MRRQHLVILALLTVPFSRSEGQVLPFTHYTPDSEVQPLPSAEVHQVYQDRLGYIWFAVYSSGLVRYDGVNMERYGRANGLRDLNVWDLTEGPAGRLWVSSNAGLVVSEKPLGEYAPGKQIVFVSEFDGVPLLDKAVNHNRLTIDSAGWLWAGTESLGIVRYRFAADGTLESDTLATRLDPGDQVPVRSLLARDDGSVWVALSSGQLLRMMTGEPVGEFNTGGRQSTSTLYETPDGVLWGGEQDGRVWRMRDEGARHRFIEASTSLSSNVVDITSVPDGSIWISSEGSGLQRIDRNDPGAVTVYTRSNGLLSEIIYNVYTDREDNLWVAQSGGVSKLRYNYRAFRNLTASSFAGEQPILPSPSVNSVLPSASAGTPCTLWAGTSERGLTCIHEDFTSTVIRAEDGLASNWVNGLEYDQSGRLWIGTSKGINSLSFGNTAPVSGRTAIRNTSLSGNAATVATYPSSSVLAVVKLEMASRPGSDQTVESIWFPAYHALYVYVNGSLHTIDPSWGFPAAVIHAAAFDDDGYLWVGTRDRGIYRSRVPVTAALLANPSGFDVDHPLFTSWWSTGTGAPSNQIETLLWHDGIMWTGTPSGLVALDADTDTAGIRILHHITTRDGLRANNATSVDISPATGNFWIGTNGGLAELDPASATVLRTVTRQNGLVDNEVWFYGSVHLDREGTVYFGTAKGISIYDPTEDRTNATPPIIRLSEATALEVPGERNEFSFAYAALSYGNEREVRYQTRLIGFNNNWSPVKTEVRTNYTNLPAFFFPETYTFEVRAVNESGVWSDEPLAYHFSVTPAWWLRWWAFLGYFIIFSAGVFGVDRFQRSRLIRKEREAAYLRENELKTEAAIARSKALQAENDLKATELEKARQLEKAYHELKSTQNRLIQSEKMASLGRLSTGLAHEMKNPLNFINNFAELSKELVDELMEALKNDDADEIAFITGSLSSNARKIEEHGKRADAIVAAMMRHSRGGAGQFEEVDLNSLVKSYADLAYHSKHGKSGDLEMEIALVIDLDSEVPPMRLIPQKIGQALQNIIENAFDAVAAYRENGQRSSPFHPEITVATRHLGEEVEIRISDNGPGIPETIREHIFEPFYTTKPTGEGTGLGLSFTYEIVHQIHHGDLKVENNPGGGAAFIISLPVETDIT